MTETRAPRHLKGAGPAQKSLAGSSVHMCDGATRGGVRDGAQGAFRPENKNLPQMHPLSPKFASIDGSSCWNC